MKLTFIGINGKTVERDATPEEIENLKALGWEPPNEEAEAVDGNEAAPEEGGEGDGEGAEGDGEGEAPAPVAPRRGRRRG